MSKLYLYTLRNRLSIDYDDYDSVVVAATCPHCALAIHPSGRSRSEEDATDPGRSWPVKDEDIEVTLLGVATNDAVKPGVIVASFNAG